MVLSWFWRNLVWWPRKCFFCSYIKWFYIVLFQYWQLKKCISAKVLGLVSPVPQRRSTPLCKPEHHQVHFPCDVVRICSAAISFCSHWGDRHLASCSVNREFVLTRPNSLCFPFFPAKGSLNFYSWHICLNVIICTCAANELIIL